MNKVICDVCGTTYPDTAEVCPICGCAKNALEQTEAESVPVEETAAQTTTKGGRFSKSNVRKRNKTSGNRGNSDGEGANKGLVVAVVLLLLAIVAVLIYIGVRFLAPKVPQLIPDQNSSSQNDQNQDDNDSSLEDNGEKYCTELKLSSSTIELTTAGTSWLLSVEKTPADTEDIVTFESSDVNVVTVDATGNIVAVGPGEATITVTCGQASAECKVMCTFEDEGGSSGEEDKEPETVIPEGFELKLSVPKYSSGYEFSFTPGYPDPVSIYKTIDGVKATDITWTSDNEEIATINENGVVTAVSKGYTMVHGTIGDQTVSCKVVVSFTPQNTTPAKYKISHTDVTLYIGGVDSFSLRLTDPANSGAPVDATWTVNEEGYVEIDGKNIRALKVTSDLKNKYVLVSATVEDHTYSCIVRIAEAKPEE